jgi:hypothetical protein
MLRWLPLMLALAACASMKQRPAEAPPALWVNPTARPPIERGTRDEPFLNLDGALRHAGAGTRIYLAPGVYRVNVRVEQALALIGDAERRPVLRAADPTRPVVELTDKASISLTNLEIGGGRHGVLVGRRAQLVMTNCQVFDNADGGVTILPAKSFWGDPPLSQLETCTLRGNRIGVSLEDAALHMLKCTVANNRQAGIAARGDSRLSLVASYVKDNGAEGVLLDLGRKARVTIYQNDLRANGGDGLRVRQAPLTWLDRGQVLAQQNTLSGNGGYGIACVQRDGGRLLATSADYDRVHLEDNQYSGNGKGMAGGIEPR